MKVWRCQPICGIVHANAVEPAASAAWATGDGRSGCARLLDHQGGDHPEHPVGALGVLQDVAVECPGAGLLAVGSTTSQRSPGLTPSVSHVNAADPSGYPSRATTRIGIPWRCHGCIMFPSFMNRMTIVSPSVATIGEVAGKPRPLIVNPPSASLLIQTMSCVAP